MGARLYQVTFPDGEKENIINLTDFCIKYDLDQGHMSKVASGKRSHHKGFLVKIIDANENSPLERIIREKRERLVAACEELILTPYKDLTARQKEDLIYTIYAIEKVYGV